MHSEIHDMVAGQSWHPGQQLQGFLPSLGVTDTPVPAPIPIAEMADLFGVTHRTLHFYEEKGLIAAQRVGMMRVYDTDNIRRMAVITACREIGISLAAIQELMGELADAQSQEEADGRFRQLLDARKRELASDISSIHRQIQHIRALMEGDQHNAEQLPPPPLLTELESRCLSLMTDGYRGKHLARQLDIDEGELAGVEASLIRKFGVANRFQAAAKAILLGILPH